MWNKEKEREGKEMGRYVHVPSDHASLPRWGVGDGGGLR
jgi:hypothetical protein